jgi:hypothetical protein
MGIEQCFLKLVSKEKLDLPWSILLRGLEGLNTTTC